MFTLIRKVNKIPAQMALFEAIFFRIIARLSAKIVKLASGLFIDTRRYLSAIRCLQFLLDEKRPANYDL